MPEISVNMNIIDQQLTMLFDPDLPVHNAILGELQQTGAYEPGTQFFFMRVLNKGDTFVDVGAHVGYFSMIGAAVVGQEGKVIAVEPIDDNLHFLQQNIANNDIPYVHAIQTVISDTNGEVQFHHNKDNDGGHALWDPREHPLNERTREAPKSETLPSMTLESLLDKFSCDHVRAMKIDTEGAERIILESGRSYFKKGAVDFVVSEVNATGLAEMGSSISDYFAYARDLGFVILLPNADGSAPKVLARDNQPDPRYVYNVILATPKALEDF